MIALMEEMQCNRILFVHNDMDEEIRKKYNVNRGLLSHAYQNYDSVAIVTPDLYESTEKIANYWKEKNSSKKANIVVVKNTIDCKKIIEMGQREIALDPQTKRNTTVNEIMDAINSDAKKFVTVGRFSWEKGHDRLINTFAKVLKDYPDCYLFIIGGYGPLFEATKKKVVEMGLLGKVFVIRYMSNPYALIQKCDYFALSSFYEGFGLVLAEADILGLPCFSTDITGPKKFMEQYGGFLVENSEEGIENGLRACLNGKVAKKLQIDYEQYNKEALEQFESLL